MLRKIMSGDMAMPEWACFNEAGARMLRKIALLVTLQTQKKIWDICEGLVKCIPNGTYIRISQHNVQVF